MYLLKTAIAFSQIILLRMKRLFIPLLLLQALASDAQKKLPVLKAGSNQAIIIEDGNQRTQWTMDPAIDTDRYTTTKVIRDKRVVFKTDTDSLVVRLSAGATKDFIVLLNGKDSCLTRIQAPAGKNLSSLVPEIHDTIPLMLNRENTVYIKAVLNDTDTLDLNFDTGTSGLVLTNKTLQNKLHFKPELYRKEYDLQIGNRHYRNPIFPAELAGHGTDGRFGWDLFDGLIVELDYDQNRMIVHSKMPEQIAQDKAWTAVKMKYYRNVFLAEAAIQQDKKTVTDWFLFDSGYQRTAMLDKDLLQLQRFPQEKMPFIKKVVMRDAQNREIPVVTSGLQALRLGKYHLADVPVQLPQANKPMQDVAMHILGNEVLKRFNIVMDFQQNALYLKPDKLFTDGYTEQ